MRRLAVPISIGLIALAAGSAWAHEFWVEPEEFRVATGKTVAFRLFVGDGFPGEAYSRNPNHVKRFELVGPGGRIDVPGRAGQDPAGSIDGPAPGVHVVAYESHPSFIELKAESFNRYLRNEGLDRVRKQRKSSGQDEEPGRELYSRCAKSVIAVGEGDRGGYDAVVGLELELIPLSDPLALRPGDKLAVEARLHGDPVSGLLLRSFRRGSDGAIRKVRTDSEGRARLRIDASGSWMVSGVHMGPHDGDEADWRSFWSSLTFHVERASDGAPLSRGTRKTANFHQENKGSTGVHPSCIMAKDFVVAGAAKKSLAERRGFDGARLIETLPEGRAWRAR